MDKVSLEDAAQIKTVVVDAPIAKARSAMSVFGAGAGALAAKAAHKSTRTFHVSPGKRAILWVRKIAKRILAYLMNKENWKNAKMWIGALFVLRALYLFMNEYGWNPFKKSLQGDHVFLTGAGAGIGRMMALKLGKMGSLLSLSDINEAAVIETKDFLIKEGIPEANIVTIRCDVSKLASIKEAAAKAREAFGPVTLLINNAGIVSGKTTMELTEPMIERTLFVNTISHLYTIREFMPDFEAKKRGHIVTIASMAGMAGLPGMSDYCASKFGAFAIDEAVRLELKKSGAHSYIKTTCICPYFIDTGMFERVKVSFPLYLLKPQEVTDRIIYAI